MAEARTVVVTGGTRGIGKGMSREFLKRGHRVVVCGRSDDSAAAAAAELAEHGEVIGKGCDVSDYASVQALWDAAVERFGGVDIWINNAGISNRRANVNELRPEEMAEVVSTNLTGSFNGCRVAIEGMRKQDNGGAVYVFEGFGSNGMTAPGLTPYGSTKRAISYMAQSLAKEVRGGNVIVGALSPGIVITDMSMLAGGRDTDRAAQARRIYNILGDRVERVTPWLVEKVLANRKNGASIKWLTSLRAAGRFMCPVYHRRDVVSDYAPGA
ncbi:MAG: SDR family NAD(P)-dependent oxidoreductase [Gammaproteobacteria bacterium]|nr:SDR family NAD(P)-dependent oxidoreductase [Gammaproteobacteria bacterium]MXW45339.1 SDR family oxidoreductase [Gammaproteobacteria bacterium]MYD01942.1 SDR family oxidoreductase [Gammaproteobacteria bacterium]MYI25534.1 SDR family oxidoreductase [Gammaproteobacteria bacterium]